MDGGDYVLVSLFFSMKMCGYVDILKLVLGWGMKDELKEALPVP